MNTRILFLCTGNAARSVMAGAIWAARFPDAPIVTAGTHVAEGRPMSVRTRDALESVGVPIPDHRSRQVDQAALEHTELVIAMEADHVRWVRRQHPYAAARTGSLRPLVADLPGTTGPLPERIAALHLAAWEPDAATDVLDPAGGETPVYEACAAELVTLLDALVATLAP